MRYFNPKDRMRYINSKHEEDIQDEEDIPEEENNVVLRGDRFVVDEDFEIWAHDIPGHRSRYNVSGTINLEEEDQLVFNGIVDDKFYEFLYYPKLNKKRAAEFAFVVLNVNWLLSHVYRA